MSNYRQNEQGWLLAVILIVAAALRFYDYGEWSLSNDELSALNRLRFDNFCEMITQGVKSGDFHPAGVQVFLWFWVEWFGNSPWMVRLPFVFAGTAAVYFVFKLSNKWFGPDTGLFSAAAMGFLQYPLLYSQIARPYSPGLLFSIMGIYFWTIIVFDKNRKPRHYIFYILSATAALYTHYFSALLMLIVGLSGLFFFRQIDIRRYLLSGVLIGLLFLPHFEITRYQMGIGGVGGPEGWLGKPEPEWILNYLKYAFNDSWLVAGVFLFFLLLPAFVKKKIPGKFQALSMIFFLMVFFTGYFYSVYRNPVLQYSVLIFVFPLLLIFLFSSLPQKPGKKIKGILLGFLLLGVIHTVFIFGYYQHQHFGEFKEVAKKIADWNKNPGKKNVTNTIVANGPYYIHYYLDQYMRGIRFAQYDNRGGTDLLELRKILDSTATPYLIHAWTKPEPREIDLLIRERFPCLIERQNYSGLSEVSLYSRVKSDTCIPERQPQIILENGFETNDLWGGNMQQRDSLVKLNGKFSYRIDPGIEYSPGIQISVDTLSGNNPENIKISVAVFTRDSLRDMPIVVTIENPWSGGYIWQSSRIEHFVLPGKWDHAYFDFLLPEIRSEKDVIKIYIWNPQRQRIWIDDWKIEIFR